MRSETSFGGADYPGGLDPSYIRNIRARLKNSCVYLLNLRAHNVRGVNEDVDPPPSGMIQRKGAKSAKDRRGVLIIQSFVS